MQVPRRKMDFEAKCALSVAAGLFRAFSTIKLSSTYVVTSSFNPGWRSIDVGNPQCRPPTLQTFKAWIPRYTQLSENVYLDLLSFILPDTRVFLTSSSPKFYDGVWRRK